MAADLDGAFPVKVYFFEIDDKLTGDFPVRTSIKGASSNDFGIVGKTHFIL
jgi:hypothetical protein